MNQVSTETCLRHLEQIKSERTFAIAALRKIEAILRTPLDKGGDHHLQIRQERLLEICIDTCKDLDARAPL
jgi:hypothetical protein